MREIALNNTVKGDSQILSEKQSIDRSKMDSLTQKELHRTLGRETTNLHRTEVFILIANLVERSGTRDISSGILFKF